MRINYSLGVSRVGLFKSLLNEQKKSDTTHRVVSLFSLARPEGFEPPAFRIGICCDIQLRHGRIWNFTIIAQSRRKSTAGPSFPQRCKQRHNLLIVSLLCVRFERSPGSPTHRKIISTPMATDAIPPIRASVAFVSVDRTMSSSDFVVTINGFLRSPGAPIWISPPERKASPST